MPWYEIRTFRREAPPDPMLPHVRPATQIDMQALKLENLEAAMAEAARRDEVLGESGYVSVYDETHERIWPYKEQ